MTIGADIKDTLREVGVSYEIVRGDGVGGEAEYTFVKSNAQVTKPFIREFFLEGFISYDTAVNVGDIVQLTTQGVHYMVMNKTPELLENEIYRYATVFYKCNELVDILRPLDREPDDRYRVSRTWTYLARQINLVISTPLYGHELEEGDVGEVSVKVFEMYAPSNVGIRPLDRIQLSTSEYYKVETVKPFRYDGVDVFGLSEDTRGVTVTTTTTTTSSTTTTTTTTL